MTTTTQTDAPALSIAAGRIARLVDLAVIAVTERSRRRATYRALVHLDDRELDDIGLSRKDVNDLR